MVATRSQTKAAAPLASESSPSIKEANRPEERPAVAKAALSKANSRVALAKKPKLSKHPDRVTPADIRISERNAQAAKSKSSTATSEKTGAQQTTTTDRGNASNWKDKGRVLSPRLKTPNLATDQSTTIMDLPPELRNSIWTIVLVQSTPIEISPIKPYVKEPALLAVSRQVRAETMSIWYAENDFTISGSSPAVRYLRSRTDQQLRSIRSLCITSEKSVQMRDSPRLWTEHLRAKTDTLMREFQSRGLRRKTLRFQVVSDMQLSWIDGENLQSARIEGDPDKDRKARGGPRKGQKILGRGVE